ncbi:MAG: hypothetical protein SFT91_02905 [Rickettsiaceae bacterium]|nr:hypothetical protein [Rickettsiaceae bacterium]
MPRNNNEIFHQQDQEVYHWYMARVSEDNRRIWLKWCKEQPYDMGSGGLALSLLLPPRLKEPDNFKLFVVYSSDLVNVCPSLPYEGHIEIACSVMTSNYAPVSTHMGIFRVASYAGEEHPKLSMKLHSFAAKCLHDKTYMITSPVGLMRYVMYKDVIKNSENFSWFGVEYREYIREYVQEGSIEEEIIAGEKELSAAITRSQEKNDRESHKVKLHTINLLKANQELLLAKGKTFCPFELDEENNTITIYDKNGAICTSTMEETYGDLSWLFTHNYMLDHKSWLTLKIDDLAAFSGSSMPIEHYFDS